MKAISITKTEGGYPFTATREDGMTVFGVLSEKDLSTLSKIVDNTKNLDEQRLQSLNLCVSSLIKLENNRKVLLSLVERWQVCSYYPLGHYVVYNDKLFRALVTHNSNYENIPINTKDLWVEVQTDTSEYDKLWNQAGYWSADLTYKKGDLVRYYNKLYRSLKDKNVSNPEKSDWELIER